MRHRDEQQADRRGHGHGRLRMPIGHCRLLGQIPENHRAGNQKYGQVNEAEKLLRQDGGHGGVGRPSTLRLSELISLLFRSTSF